VVVFDCAFIGHALHTWLFTFNRVAIFRLLKPAGFNVINRGRNPWIRKLNKTGNPERVEL
jgi:hypothetical protein